MKVQQRQTRIALTAVTFVAAGVCLSLGFWSGARYSGLTNAGPSATDVITLQSPGARQPAGGSQPVTTSTNAAAFTPYYGRGTTRFDKAKPLQGSVCLNTCTEAKDKQCNDGRMKPGQTRDLNSPREVLCDLGTDCDDCGPWTPSGHAPWITDARAQPGPIARLRKAGIQVRVRPAGMQLGFEFAYTDPNKDYDVSWHVENSAVVEAGMTDVFHKVFEKCDPAKNGGKRGLFVDVGANFGWFSVLAASMGCKVIAFEPVPHFHAFLEFSVHLNGLAHLVDMRSNVVSHVSGSTLKMVVPSHGIWGTAGIDGLNIDQNIKSSNQQLEVPSQKLDDLIKEDVLLLKVDVEGWEWSVMQGAAQLIKTYNVENVMMEYSPGVPERTYRMKEVRATIQMLVNLVDAGYRIANLGEHIKHTAGTSASPIPPMEEVTGHNLMYDLVDAELVARAQLGCPPVAALSQFEPWNSCGSLPEDINPRSLRSQLGHNTNLWAAKGSKLQVLQGTVGILPLNAPANQFFVEQAIPSAVHGGAAVWYGMGARLCHDMLPPVQVRHRCHCTNETACGAEESIAANVAASGGFASNYVLAPDGTLLSGTGHVRDMFQTMTSARKIGEPYLPGAVKGLLS